MLDPKLIRQELETTALRLRTKGFDLDVALIRSLESRRKEIQVQVEALQAQRNTQSKAIGKAKSQGEDIQPLLDAVADLGDQLDDKKQRLDEVQSELNALLMAIPNLPDESVPEGQTEDDNVQVRIWGDPPEFDFTPLDHVDLTDGSNKMGFEQIGRASCRERV